MTVASSTSAVAASATAGETSCRRAASTAAQLPIHDLRHTYASVALARGVHPKVVQEAMGHSTIAVTLDLYSHVVPTLQRDAAP